MFPSADSAKLFQILQRNTRWTQLTEARQQAGHPCTAFASSLVVPCMCTCYAGMLCRHGKRMLEMSDSVQKVQA